jgi:hypothetical protein
VTTKLIPIAVAGGLALTACGNDGDVRSEAAAVAIESAEAEGLRLDERCVGDIADQLSEDDARAIVEAGPDDRTAPGEEGAELGRRFLACVDEDALIDVFVDDLRESGEAFDEECVRANLEDVDLTAALDESESSPDLVRAVLECLGSDA